MKKYSNFRNADVSLYGDKNKVICMLCKINDNSDVYFKNFEQLNNHLREHVKKGNFVPDKLFGRCTYEIK